MKNTQKGFVGVIIIVILAVALGVGGTYYLTKPKQDVYVSMDTNSTTSASTVKQTATTTERSKQVTIQNSDVLSARGVLLKIQEVYSPHTVIESGVEGYYGQTKGYRLIVKSEDVGKIEGYLKSTLSLKIAGASELGYSFENGNGASKSTFGCITSTGRPQVETDETESGFYPATEAYVYCYDMKS